MTTTAVADETKRENTRFVLVFKATPRGLSSAGIIDAVQHPDEENQARSRRPLSTEQLRASAVRGGLRFTARQLFAAFAAIALPAAAHHSLATYDVDQSIHFDGVVETLRLQNPHIALTLTVTKGDGTRGTISFAGAPAGMLARMGLTAMDIAVGKPIKAIGAPGRDDPNVYFLKAIILPDGRRFTFAD